MPADGQDGNELKLEKKLDLSFQVVSACLQNVDIIDRIFFFSLSLFANGYIFHQMFKDNVAHGFGFL